MDHMLYQSDAALASLLAFVAALDAAECHDDAGPRARPDVLERFLDPAIQAALPEGLRQPAATYLDRLPGWRDGDVQRAAEQHALRVALWQGDAQVVDEMDWTALGLQEEESRRHG